MTRFRLGVIVFFLYISGPLYALERCAFIPFRNVSAGKDLEPIGTALSTYLERDIRLLRPIAGSVEPADATAAVGKLNPHARDRISTDELRSLAGRLRASELFWGAYTIRSRRRTVEVVYYETDIDQTTSVEQSSIEDSVFRLIDNKVMEIAERHSWKIPENARKLLGERETDVLEAYVEALEGDRWVREAQWEKARSSYATALDADGGFLRCFVNRGNCLIMLGKVAQAKSDFETVLGSDRKNWEAYNNLGTICRKQGDVWKAISNFSKGLEINPDSEILLFNRGNAYGTLNMDVETKSDYEKILAVRGDCAPALYQLGLFYLRRDAKDRSLEFWFKAKKADPTLLEKSYMKQIQIDDILVWPGIPEGTGIRYVQ